MKINTFEELEIWQDARKFVVQIHTTFRELRDFSFKDQICRAALSVSNNIVEGFERKGNKEFIRFLNIARSSLAEVRSMLHIGADLNYISNEIYTNLLNLAETISKRIYALIKYLKTTLQG